MPVFFYSNGTKKLANWAIPVMHYIIMPPSHMSGYSLLDKITIFFKRWKSY